MKGWAKSEGLKLAGKHGKMGSLLYKVEDSAAAGGRWDAGRKKKKT